MWQSTGGISWRAPLYGNLKACSLRDALIVSNRRVAKYLCHHRTIRSEKWFAGCERRSSGWMVRNPYLGIISGLSVIRECLQSVLTSLLAATNGEIGGNSTKRPFRLPLDIATRLEKWI